MNRQKTLLKTAPENLPPSIRHQRKSDESDESEESDDDRHSMVRQPRTEENGGINLFFVGAVLVLVAAIILSYFKCESGVDDEKLRTELENMLKNVKNNFPTQRKDLWGFLLSVLATVSRSDSLCPKAILLLDQGDSGTLQTSQCLVKMVANQSAYLLPSEEKRALYLSGDDLNCSDCVEVQRAKVKKHGIVVMQHLEKFPIPSAEALHFFCDEHETGFAKAAYLLTMTVNNMEKNPTKAAENALRTSWKSMQIDNIDAVISRLTSLVVFVQPETILNCD